MRSSQSIVSFKIMLIGDRKKSVWRRRLSTNEYIPNKGMDDNGDLVTIPFGNYKIACHDLSINNDVADGYIQTKTLTDAFLIFYDISSRDSFDKVDQYVNRLEKRNSVNQCAKILLIGVHESGHYAVSEDEANRKARQYGLQDYYGVHLASDDYRKIKLPIDYIMQNSPNSYVKIPAPDFKSCYREIDNALRSFPHDASNELKDDLNDFKFLLQSFPHASHDMTIEEVSRIHQACNDILKKASEIFEAQYPERVKTAILGAVATVLFFTAIVCGLALLNIITLPFLIGTLALGIACALSGTGGAVSLGYSLFKAKENAIYSSMLALTRNAVKDTKQEAERVLTQFGVNSRSS